MEICRQHGVLFAPHDNYIDLYPDAEGFSYENVAFQSNGQPHRAWYHANEMRNPTARVPIVSAPWWSEI